MPISKLAKTLYDNSDSSPKDTQTGSDDVGAWDMEQITNKINEVIDVVNGTPPTQVKGIRINTSNAAVWTLDIPFSPLVVEIDFVLEQDVSDYQAFMGSSGYYQTMFQNSVDANAIFDQVSANTSIELDNVFCGPSVGTSTPLPVGVSKSTLIDGNVHTIKFTKSAVSGVMSVLGNNGSRPLQGVITKLTLDGDVFDIEEGTGDTITSASSRVISLTSGTSEWATINI